MDRNHWMQTAIELAYENTRREKGRPFGAIIVKDGKIVGKGVNQILATHDPTMHAELEAIREASRTLATSDLSDCELYASGKPCPMCLAAIYWANIQRVYYAYTEEEAAEAGLSAQYVYDQLALPEEKREIQLTPMEKDTSVKNPYALWKEINR
ncbi:nucleoside deaminase [Kroppenstedtia eburnea]|uniref:Guanine deaminase n=1 Tax=Kroppenstedtia eburnea TaxID=714067 RepID=A0A1N7IRR5_9BACL|nr:nucleoside deaminase [Kroppenstedtia eburnea]QKI82131.1 nucleoside deaminase [Kroppenstedtia eburnea]SIS39778.1 guanine deaminase [Kroppenstedtia eburnea]